MALPASLVAASRVEGRSKYAVGMAIGMLAVNLVGFAPTLYLRPFFDVPPIPGYLYAHGAIGTAWFVLLVVQTTLVATNRVSTHRQLGRVGAALATLIIVSGMYTSANMVPRNVAMGLTSETDMTLYAVVTSADNSAFIVFSTLVLLAVYFRRRPDVHEAHAARLVEHLGAGRGTDPELRRRFSEPGGPGRFVAVIIVFGFLIAMLVNDVVTHRRPHLVTVLGALFFFAVSIGMQLSGVGPALVEQRMPQ